MAYLFEKICSSRQRAFFNICVWQNDRLLEKNLKMGFNVTTERLRGRELKCENMLAFGAYLFTTSASKLSAIRLLLKARLEIYSSAPQPLTYQRLFWRLFSFNSLSQFGAFVLFYMLVVIISIQFPSCYPPNWSTFNCEYCSKETPPRKLPSL